MVVEVMKYLGVGYNDVISTPRWVLDVVLIRMKEDAEYQRYQAQRSGSGRV